MPTDLPKPDKTAENTAMLAEATGALLEKNKATAPVAIQASISDREDKREDARIEAAAILAAAAKVDAAAFRAMVIGVISTIVIALPATIGAVASAISVLRINEVGHSVNSMKDELVDEVRKNAQAQGFKEGKAARGP